MKSNEYSKPTECSECKECEICEQEIKEKKPGKAKAFFYKFGKRNAVIAATVLIIGAAVWLNWTLFAKTLNPQGYQGYDDQETPTNSTPTDSTPTLNETETYFSATQISRQRARDEAMEVLQSVVENVDADEVSRSEALTSISVIADEIQKEANIESLITAKGFAQCVAVLNNDTANIIVSSEEDLQPAQIAQIKEIVYSQAGILPGAVTIIHK